MNKSNSASVVLMIALGLVLVLLKIVYLFFDFYNIIDVVVFSLAGFIVSGRITLKRRLLALLIALPAVLLCLLIVLRLGYSSIIQGVGMSYAVSLIVIPLATYMGIFIRSKRTDRKGA